MVVDLFNVWPGIAVFDADALNAISESKQWWSALSNWQLSELAHSTVPLKTKQSDSDYLSTIQGARILTPHPGEWERLTNIKTTDSEKQQREAIEFAKHIRSVIVLKGHRTLVTDGERVYRNTTGNPSMAVGGSGDVLTGIIVALACQGLSAYDAAVLGVYLHGLAGDIAHFELGTPSTLGTDLIGYLPAAFRRLNSQSDG